MTGSVANPAGDAQTNVVGTVNVLEAARAAGARVLLCSTGGALYGRDAPIPSHGGRAAAARVAVRDGQVLRRAVRRPVQPAARHGWHSVLRLANVYGPRQDPAGECRRGADLLRRGWPGRGPTVYGDGAQTRDYVYVGDVVAAFLAAADRSRPGTWNIGTGTEVSVLDLVRADRRGVRPRRSTRSCARPGRASCSAARWP